MKDMRHMLDEQLIRDSEGAQALIQEGDSAEKLPVQHEATGDLPPLFKLEDHGLRAERPEEDRLGCDISERRSEGGGVF